jgi:hypothetical protein
VAPPLHQDAMIIGQAIIAFPCARRVHARRDHRSRPAAARDGREPRRRPPALGVDGALRGALRGDRGVS